MKRLKNLFKGKVLTIPNILSFFRIALIPVFVWMYLGRNDSLGTALVLLLSGITDTLDGWIARRFNMISELGKALDPVADKLTQLIMIFCLLFRFRAIRWLFAVLCCKELFVGITSLIAIRKAGKVLAANWHGKMTTALMYAVMVLHLLWADIPDAASVGAVSVCIASVLLSGILYGIRNFRAMKAAGDEKEKDLIVTDKDSDV